MSEMNKSTDMSKQELKNTKGKALEKAVRKQKGNEQDEKRRAERQRIWPNVENELLWFPKESGNFAQIPRITPFIMQAIDQIVKKKTDKSMQASKTYLALLCNLWNQSYIKIDRPNEMARASGFSTQRAIKTWNSHMRTLRDLGFIDTREGASSEFTYILIYHPYKVIEEKYSEIIQPWLWHTMLEKGD